MASHVLVIDQGTTSTRAIVFGPDAAPVAAAQEEFPQIFPQPGWVEHDPEAIWATTLATSREAMRRARLDAKGILAIGVANQRETTLIWDRATGRPIANAIVWQDRRTADICARLKGEGHEAEVNQSTGLLLDPYFSATKIVWLLDHTPDARLAAERGELAFGTVDTFLLWRLTNGAVHATDATNASRTMLYDLRKGAWDARLLELFRIPAAILPEIRDTAADYGESAPEHFGAPIPIRAMVGDQQGALIGQACFEPGALKATFGTGGFLLLNTGTTPVWSKRRMLTTVAYQWRGERTYALEGSIFSAGATVQWLRDGLGIIAKASEANDLAAAADPAEAVYLVPAFSGLGAPHWNAEARGILSGLTRGSTAKEIARAALESVGYQTRDLVEAMAADWGEASGARRLIRVDGGMAASDWTMQFLADMLAAPVERPAGLETTAQGAAFAAGWQAGLYAGPQDFATRWRREQAFAPQMEAARRDELYRGWRGAVARALLES
jgi:glycerol kinase